MPKYMLIITPDTKLPNPVLIPSPPATGCPNGTLGCSDGNCPATCFCEDHCSWEKCSLDEKPDKCLSNQYAMWVWDPRYSYWTAQYKGNYHDLVYTLIIYITCILIVVLADSFCIVLLL